MPQTEVKACLILWGKRKESDKPTIKPWARGSSFISHWMLAFHFQDFMSSHYSLTFSGSASHCHCCSCWFGFPPRRLQWGHSWWRWGSWQSDAADPPEQPTGSQPHHLLRAGRCHSGRKKERGSTTSWDREGHSSQEDAITDSRGSRACSKLPTNALYYKY